MLPVEAANRLLDAYLQDGGNYYCGLLTSLPVNSDTESNLEEPTYGGYARVAVTFDTNLWNDASNASATNKTVITFPSATSTPSPRETCNGAFFVTAASGGVIIAVGRLIQPLEIVAGKQLRIPAEFLTMYAVFDANIG